MMGFLPTRHGGLHPPRYCMVGLIRWYFYLPVGHCSTLLGLIAPLAHGGQWKREAVGRTKKYAFPSTIGDILSILPLRPVTFGAQTGASKESREPYLIVKMHTPL